MTSTAHEDQFLPHPDDVAQAQPKRRPYNASASLSEYGVFPECDAAPVAQPAAIAEPSDEEAAKFADQYGMYYDQDASIAGAHARALLSRYGRPAGDAQPIRLEHMAVADEGGLRWMSGRKMPAGVESVELYAVPGYGKAPKFVYTAPVAAQHADDADPLQGAADWLVKALAKPRTTEIAARLLIGYNRAERLFDAAIAQQRKDG